MVVVRGSIQAPVLAATCCMCPGLGFAAATAVSAGSLTELPRHHHVPVVLDCVVCAAWEEASNHGPFVSVKPVGCQEPILLVFCERASVDAWVQLIEPT